MPGGSKSRYTDKQKRKAEHIEKSCEKRGASKGVAEKRAWQTVNKQSGGGEKSSGGRKTSERAKSAARSRKIGSRRVQKTLTRHKASSVKRKSS
jgi:plasmid stabilization system protein ParE